MLLAPDTGAEAAGEEAHAGEQTRADTGTRAMEQAREEAARVRDARASNARELERAQQEREHAVSGAREDAAHAQEEAQLERECAAGEAAEKQATEPAQDARELALAAREREIERRELRAQALERLAAQHLPALLAETLDYTDAQSMENSLEAMREAWTQAVQKGIEERMKGAAPRTGGVAVRPGTLREAIEGRYAGV